MTRVSRSRPHHFARALASAIVRAPGRQCADAPLPPPPPPPPNRRSSLARRRSPLLFLAAGADARAACSVEVAAKGSSGDPVSLTSLCALGGVAAPPVRAAISLTPPPPPPECLF